MSIKKKLLGMLGRMPVEFTERPTRRDPSRPTVVIRTALMGRHGRTLVPDSYMEGVCPVCLGLPLKARNDSRQCVNGHVWVD